MNQGKYVYSQLTDFLPKRIFDGLADKYLGDKYVKHFSCWNQLLCMVLGQLTGRDSLRDLMIRIEPHKPKYCHLGFGKGPQYPILPMPMRNVIVDFLKNTSSISSIKHGNPWLLIRIFNWTLMGIFMPSILQPLIYVWTCSGGPSSVKRRVVLNCIQCMTLKPPSLVISMYQPHQYMM